MNAKAIVTAGSVAFVFVFVLYGLFVLLKKSSASTEITVMEKLLTEQRFRAFPKDADGDVRDYAGLKLRYDKRRRVYESNAESYQRFVEEYERQATYWNERQTISPVLYVSLKRDRERIRAFGVSLDEQRLVLNGDIERLNAMNR
jgi:hypothetical protein